MKPKLGPLFLILSIAFLVGTIFGALVQKNLGVGNVLRRIGIPYPTAAPVADISAIVDIPPAYRGQLKLFILAGQSNMVGWAPVPQNEKSDPRVFVFSNGFLLLRH